jgi:DNA-binding XRE family transcriptional regulator
MALMTVTSVDAMPKARLRVNLSTGRVIEVDVAQYLNAPGYERLRKPASFAKADVAEWGHGVCWPGDIAIPVEALYRLAKEQAGQAWPTHRFNAWMKRHGLSAAQAAKALGLTRRTILYYHTGAKPIPIYIALACEGWEHRQLKAA